MVVSNRVTVEISQWELAFLELVQVFDLVGQASQYPGDFLAFLVKCLVLGVDFNFKHDSKNEKGGELGSQLLDFFVKLFDVEVIIKKAYVISREWLGS